MQSATYCKQSQTNVESICDSSTENVVAVQDASTFSSGGLYTADNTTKSNDEHTSYSSGAHEVSTAQAALITSLGNEKIFDESELIDPPDYKYECEIEAMYVENETVGDIKYDDSYFNKSEEIKKSASTSTFDYLYTNGVANNAHGK